MIGQEVDCFVRAVQLGIYIYIIYIAQTVVAQQV